MTVGTVQLGDLDDLLALYEHLHTADAPMPPVRADG
jgi:hypothetical protein